MFFENKIHLYLYNLCKYFCNNGVILTLRGSILYPQSSSILKNNPRHLDLVMHLVLKSYSRCSAAVVHSEPKISNTYGPHFVLLCKFTKATYVSQGDIIYEIFLSCLQSWQSFSVVVHVKPEISILVLILCLLCKLNPSQVTAMMTSSKKFFIHVCKSEKVHKLWYF